MNKYILLLCVVAFGLVSCDSDSFTFDLQDNPNAPTAASADIDLVLNTVVGSTVTTESRISAVTNDLVRYTNQFGPYTGQFSTASVEALSNGAAPWAVGYTAINNAKLVMKLADEQKLPHHKGLAQVLTASTLISLVDAYGDVVYSEAANPEFTAPFLDNGEDVYEKAIVLLDEGIANLSSTEQVVPLNDYIYGDAAKWIKYANTLKIAAYVNTRLVWNKTEELKAIIDSGNYIKSSSDDFQYNYSDVVAPVDSRSGLFTSNYISGADAYIGNYMIYMLKDRFTESDPRLRFYVYRQTGDDPTGTDYACAGAGYDYCYLGDGYWGRDHGDDLGVPADGLSRSLPGIYPAGGAYDEDQFLSGDKVNSLGGKGIEPLLLSSQVDFLLAEAALTMNTGQDAEALLESGIKKSFAKVGSFAPGKITPEAVKAYVERVLKQYNAADANKLDVVITELYLASYMDGSVAYDAYRRTGYPSNIQSPVVSIGKFPRSLFLPTSETETNTNIDQKKITDQVFWDTNDAGFID